MNEQNYAVVANDKVVNVVVWDGVQPYDPGDGVEMIPLPYTTDDNGARRYIGGIGWTWNGTTFIDKRVVEEESSDD